MSRGPGPTFTCARKLLSACGDAVMTDSDRTITLAEQALSQIKALHLSGDPQSFEIWYTYVAGTRPQLNAHINDILATPHPLAHRPRPDLLPVLLARAGRRAGRDRRYQDQG